MQSVNEHTMRQLFRVFPGMEYCDLKHDHVTGLSKVHYPHRDGRTRPIHGALPILKNECDLNVVHDCFLSLDNAQVIMDISACHSMPTRLQTSTFNHTLQQLHSLADIPWYAMHMAFPQDHLISKLLLGFRNVHGTPGIAFRDAMCALSGNDLTPCCSGCTGSFGGNVGFSQLDVALATLSHCFVVTRLDCLAFSNRARNNDIVAKLGNQSQSYTFLVCRVVRQHKYVS